MGVSLVGGELVELRLIFLAGLDFLLAHSMQFADIDQRILGLRHQAFLQFEQGLDCTEVFFGIALAGAARQYRGCGGLYVERKFAEHETYLAGVDIFRTQHRKDILTERRAMRAAHRRIFGDGHRRLRRPDGDVGEGYRFGDASGNRALRHRGAREGE